MIINALLNLRPGAQWTLDRDDYEGLVWLDEIQTKPTKKEIAQEIERIQLEYQTKEYQRQRAPEYPDLKEFVDAYYWSQKGDDTKMNQYITKCDEVKSKYPKI